MKLIEFIKQYADKRNEITKIVFEWYWVEEGIDEEYCFEGKPSEFVEKYTKDYDCIKDVEVFDVHKLEITNDGKSKIYIKVIEE